MMVSSPAIFLILRRSGFFAVLILPFQKVFVFLPFSVT